MATYGDLAEWAGYPGAARAVGRVMATAGDGLAPYHRVIAAGGRLGGFGGHEDLKRDRLRAEGVMVSGNQVRHFASVRWQPRPRRRARG